MQVNVQKMQIEKKSVETCPVCGSSERSSLYYDLEDNIFFCVPGKWKLFKCAKCRSAYLDPVPSPDTVHLAYSNYYTHNSKQQGNYGKLNYIKHSLYDSYCRWRFGGHFSGAALISSILINLAPKIKKTVEDTFRNLPPLTYENSRLLDVGFGNASFLEKTKNIGWEVAGVDFDSVVVEAALEKQLNVRQGNIDEFLDQPETFDIITLSHVLEHVHDPRGLIQTAFQLLKPGGWLWIETPNIESFGHDHYGRFWRGLEAPRHLILFNWSTLELILRQEGYDSIVRLPKFNSYLKLASKSSLIKAGKSPYDNRELKNIERLYGNIISLRTRLNYQKTELVTLKAQKPL